MYASSCYHNLQREKEQRLKRVESLDCEVCEEEDEDLAALRSICLKMGLPEDHGEVMQSRELDRISTASDHFALLLTLDADVEI